MKSGENRKTVLGFSGGVDSTAACLLLQENGFEVTGLYFDVLPGGPSEGAFEAENRAKELGIPFHYVSASKLFSEAVIADFCKCYQEGRTPNPCVICNPLVKFRILADYADEIGAAHIATGHYARICQIPSDAETGSNVYCVKRAVCTEKDQSYMLYRLRQNVLSRLLLPLGEMESKEQVRSYVHEHNISNFAQKDSQDICFLPPDVSYADYLKEKGITCENGIFCNQQGEKLADSKGYLHYTIGQRKGFGVGFGKPMFVTKLDAANNRVYLGDEELLFTREVKASHLCLSEKYFCKPTAENALPVSCTAKIRYRAKPAPCTVQISSPDSDAFISADSAPLTSRLKDAVLTCTFDEPQRAPTPGQSIVFYDGDIVIGGGILL